MGIVYRGYDITLETIIRNHGFQLERSCDIFKYIPDQRKYYYHEKQEVWTKDATGNQVNFISYDKEMVSPEVREYWASKVAIDNLEAILKGERDHLVEKDEEGNVVDSCLSTLGSIKCTIVDEKENYVDPRKTLLQETKEAVWRLKDYVIKSMHMRDNGDSE